MEDLLNILDLFEGQNLNIAVGGEINVYLCLEGFYYDYFSNNDRELIMLETETEDKHFSIDMDCVEEYTYDELLNQLVFATINGNIIQIWSDV